MHGGGRSAACLFFVLLLWVGIQTPAAQIKAEPLNSVLAHAQTHLTPNYGVIYRKWLDEEVRYIISDEERSEFNQTVTDQQRDGFVEKFWERRNPNPGSPENKLKEEHYRRLGYSNQHFASS